MYNFRNGCFSHFSQSLYRCEFHRLVDLCCPHIKGTAKNIGKAKYIIYLVWIIASAGCHNDVLTGKQSRIIGNLRIRVGHGENDWVLCHGSDHILAKDVANTQPNKNIGILHCPSKIISAESCINAKLLLQFRNVSAPFV